MNNKLCIATMLLALGAFSPLYGVVKPSPHKGAILGVQQDGKLTGTVVDEAGIPVIGANILVKGTTNGTITDLDGHFVLSDVPDNAIIVVSYIGYLDQEIPANGKTSLDIKLKENTQKLDEVVVVGYGVQKKVNMTGSISNVKDRKSVV